MSKITKEELKELQELNQKISAIDLKKMAWFYTLIFGKIYLCFKKLEYKIKSILNLWFSLHRYFLRKVKIQNQAKFF